MTTVMHAAELIGGFFLLVTLVVTLVACAIAGFMIIARAFR